MDVETLIEAATPEEAEVIARVLVRRMNRPAVVVTSMLGRRHVVIEEDERRFAGIPDGPYKAKPADWRIWFGAQWVRKYGRVDEMLRSLSLADVSRVQRVDRGKVWGSG